MNKSTINTSNFSKGTKRKKYVVNMYVLHIMYIKIFAKILTTKNILIFVLFTTTGLFFHINTYIICM